MIAIDFQGGQHGNFLEFVCNKHLAGVECPSLPFNQQGASHRKGYLSSKSFQCGHFFMDFSALPDTTEKIISIKITEHDLLPLSAVSLLRAGDYGIDNNELETDTFHKLNNIHYRSTLDNLIAGFFHGKLKQSYDAVRDPSWPDIKDIGDFNLLPEWIQQECTMQHGIRPLVLDHEHPHCPRSILREFFKIGFKDPNQSGFISTQNNKMIYPIDKEVRYFSFGAFYHTDQFIEQLDLIAEFTNTSILNAQALELLHQEFLQRQPYRFLKQITDQRFFDIVQGLSVDLNDLNLLQEAYLDAKLEVAFDKEAPSNRDRWFENCQQIRQYFDI